MDVVIAEEQNINLTKVYVHFTGNANGGMRQVELSGISATVMAGTNIIELGYRKQITQVVYWAAIHELDIFDTRYITHMLIAGGNRSADIISVIFAKPEHRTYKNISITAERKVNARRALMDEKCTVIFATAQSLQKLVHYFRHVEIWKKHPQIQIGFMDAGTQPCMTQIGEQQSHISVTQYKNRNKLFNYRSNKASGKQRELQDSKERPAEIKGTPIGPKCHTAVAILQKGLKEMEASEFKEILDELCLSMNLQIKQKEIDNKRPISSVNQIIIDATKGGAVWGGSKHSARLEQKKMITEQEMDLSK